jgi:hypothetical protein
VLEAGAQALLAKAEWQTEGFEAAERAFGAALRLQGRLEGLMPAVSDLLDNGPLVHLRRCVHGAGLGWG